MKRTTAIAILLSLTGSAAIAADDNNYKHEIQAYYSSSTENFSDGRYGLSQRSYFGGDGVNQSNVPYALSGELAQKTNFGTHFAGFNGNGKDYHVDFEFVFDSKIFIAAKYYKTELKDYDVDGYFSLGDYDDFYGMDIDRDFTVQDYKSDGYIGAIGFYFDPTSSIYLDYRRGNLKNYPTILDTEFEYKTTTNNFGIGANSFVDFVHTAGLYMAAKYTYTSYDLELVGYSPTTEDSINSIDLALDWYLTQSFSIGGKYHADDGSFVSNDDDYDYNVTAAYFWRMTDLFSARLEVTKQLEPQLDGAYGRISLDGRF
ncbi:hypothetical protein [uncultured Shewanella sp.]|uniref:hypothetical protein n=1 Tax=uncultured Shewanella sp. TaxID=173975 RepID=UPI0026378864|nr:hypothetical protein [uncultured Shewanella sp.]